MNNFVVLYRVILVKTALMFCTVGLKVWCAIISARALPSCRATLAVMGFFGGIVINLLRNNLSVGIVCMTIDSSTDQNTSVSNQTRYRPTESWSYMNILFPKIRRSSSYHYFSGDDFEDCPNDPFSDPGYEGVSESVPILRQIN